MSFLGVSYSEEEIRRRGESTEMRTFIPSINYKWGYCFVPATGELETGSYLNRIDTRDFIIFKKFLSRQLGDNFEATKGFWYGRPTTSGETIKILTNIELDILYIKMVSNFDLVKKINFADELEACLERQRLIHIYDEEHMDQTIRKMKRLCVRRKPFGAKTPQLNKLDSLKTDRKIISYK